MKRNIKKIIAEYDGIKKKINSNYYDLYSSDIYAIWDASKPAETGRNDTAYKLTANAFDFGFVLGYKAAKLEAKRKAAGKRAKIPTA